MMVETLTSAPFTTLIGKNIIVEAAEAELAIEVISVKENPLAAGPNAKRTPFSVVLRGPDSPSLSDGSYHLRSDDKKSWRLENIYLNRIIPLAESDGTGAFYQAIFG
jgi:hypothetical protein